MEFRKLRADEIDCRVNTINEKGLSLLLYKDARCDMNILDETVGCMNWKRSHTRDNANCIVSIYNKEIGEWVSKEDTGTESYTEKEKGLASDSFKRACFNWGIGRELYTSPFIWISSALCTITPKGDKYTTYDNFRVKKIGYSETGEINSLVIVNAKTNKVVYELGNSMTPDEIKQEMPIQQLQKDRIKELPKDLIMAFLTDRNKNKISELNYLEAEQLIKEGELSVNE